MIRVGKRYRVLHFFHYSGGEVGTERGKILGREGHPGLSRIRPGSPEWPPFPYSNSFASSHRGAQNVRLRSRERARAGRPGSRPPTRPPGSSGTWLRWRGETQARLRASVRPCAGSPRAAQRPFPGVAGTEAVGRCRLMLCCGPTPARALLKRSQGHLSGRENHQRHTDGHHP